ncbi:MAG: NAD(+)/NADH kinase [Hyphomicrobiaceae bacterium]|nr:NAD(+)/NADH kinase [Hyphomicrobiaceae bacterium]
MGGSVLVRSRFLIVHNASAGLERHRLLDRVRAALEAAGALVRVEAADGVEADRRLAAEAVRTRAFDAVVAAGGDSTIRGVAGGLVGTPMPLGIIPIGTGNVLAEELRLVRTPQAIARYLLHGAAIQVSPGIANGELFLSMASAGFDAGVLSRLDMGWKRRIGKLAYVWPTLRELCSSRCRFEVLVDGIPHPCTWVVVTRGAHYAGSFVIAPRQRLSDPGFHALVVDAASPAALASALVAVGLGWAQRHPLIETIACRRVAVAAGQGVGFQLDGEPITALALEISAGRHSLALIMPGNG